MLVKQGGIFTSKSNHWEIKGTCGAAQSFACPAASFPPWVIEMTYRCIKCGELIEPGEESVWDRYEHYHVSCHSLRAEKSSYEFTHI